MGSSTPTWLFIVFTLLTGSGLFVAARAIFGDRARGRLRCPSCWYDMSTMPHAARCPECGRELNGGELSRTRRRWGWAALGVVLAVLPWTFLHPGVRRQIVRLYTPAYTTTARYELNGYAALEQTATDPMDMKYYRVVIYQGRRLLYDTNKDGDTYFHHYVYPRYATPIGLPLGADVTGDGVPDLIIEHNTGGNGCGSGLTIFQVGKEAQGGFKRLADLPCGHFQDVDGDGLPEFLAVDCSFAMRWTSHAGSPYPEVVMNFKDGAYVVDVELMRKAAPSIESLRETYTNLLAMTRHMSDADPFPDLLRTSLDLIYSGNERLARALLREFLSECERHHPILQGTFLPEFDQTLDSSPFAKDLEPLRQRE